MVQFVGFTLLIYYTFDRNLVIWNVNPKLTYDFNVSVLIDIPNAEPLTPFKILFIYKGGKQQINNMQILQHFPSWPNFRWT